MHIQIHPDLILEVRMKTKEKMNNSFIYKCYKIKAGKPPQRPKMASRPGRQHTCFRKEPLMQTPTAEVTAREATDE